MAIQIISCGLDPHSALKLIRKGMAERLCGDCRAAAKTLQTAVAMLAGEDDEFLSEKKGIEKLGAQSWGELCSGKKQLAITYNQQGMDLFRDEEYRQAQSWFTQVRGGALYNHPTAILCGGFLTPLVSV